MRRHALLAMLLVGFGCDRGTKAEHADCSAAVAALAKTGADVTLTSEQLHTVETAIATRCRDDKWSGEAVACIAKATDAAGRGDCFYKHLTPEQKDRLDEATLPLRTVSVERTLAKMRELKDAMCACADPGCAQGVSDAMTRWSMEKRDQAPPKLRAEEAKEAAAIGEEMGRCMQVAMDRSGSANQANVDRAMAKMASFKDRMCACKDVACATKVSDDMTAWAQDEAKRGNPTRMSQADTKRAAAIGDEMGRCMQAAMVGQ